MSKKYDFTVIGSGPAAQASAIKMAQCGFKCAVIEMSPDSFGGVCLNEGCIPAKAMLHRAGLIACLRRNAHIAGIKREAISANHKKIIDESRKAVEKLRKGLLFLFKKNGIDIIYGKGTFISGREISVCSITGEKSVICAENILIATGSKPKRIPGLIRDGKMTVYSTDVVHDTSMPGKVAVIGAGAIGVEFASFYNMLGAEVTLIEVENNILPLEDRAVSNGLAGIFRRSGIVIKTGSAVKRSVTKNGKVILSIEGPTAAEDIAFERVLVAAGREPLTAEMGLEPVGVKTDDRGFIKVDNMMKTSAPNIYAAGDVVKSPMLAHVAGHEGKVAAGAIAGNQVTADYSAIPNAIYSGVKAASVGKNEQELEKAQVDYRTGMGYFKANGRAVAIGEEHGFIKILADAGDRRILGAHIVGHAADEIIHEFVAALKMKMTVDDMIGTLHAHPTFSELSVNAAKAVFGSPLHG